MDKPFGIRGDIQPHAEAFSDISDTITYDNDITISMHGGVFEVGFNKETSRGRALNIANNYLALWSIRNGVKIEVNFNQTWKVTPQGGQNLSMELHEDIKIADRLITTTTIQKGLSYVVQQHHDSYSFANDTDIARKAERDQTLSLALQYFYKECMDTKQAMSGIHRAIEQITKHLGVGNDASGRTMLAQLVGQNRQYVDDLMTSVQEGRHSLAWLTFNRLRPIITEQQCKDRAKNLIWAYATSIP